VSEGAIMQTVQSWFGFSAPPKKAAAPHAAVTRHKEMMKEKSPSEVLQEKMITQRVNMRAEQSMQKLASAEAQKAYTKNDKQAWATWKKTEKEHKLEEEKWQRLLKQTQQLLRMQEGTQANLQQGLLLQEVNKDVGETLEAMQELKVDDAMDTTRDLAEQAAQYDELFSETLIPPSGAEMEYADGLDDEWEALKAQQADEQMPEVPLHRPVQRQHTEQQQQPQQQDPVKE